MVADEPAAPLRHAGASTGWQRVFSEVRQALTSAVELPVRVSGVEPNAAREPKEVAAGAAMAANFRNVRRLLIFINFNDHSADSCLLI
jgi:hypothetical protein